MNQTRSLEHIVDRVYKTDAVLVGIPYAGDRPGLIAPPSLVTNCLSYRHHDQLPALNCSENWRYRSYQLIGDH